MTLAPSAFLDRQRHRLPAVDASVGGAVLEAVAHLRHVAHEDRLAAALLDHEVTDLQRILDLAGNPNREALRPELHVAAGDRDVLVRHRVDHVVERQPVEPQALGVDVDLHLALETADQVHPQHPGQRLERVL